LKRIFDLMRHLCTEPIHATYFVKYFQLPNDWNSEYSTNDKTNIDEAINKFDMSKARILQMFSLFSSPMMKNSMILKTFIETLSMICHSHHMYLTQLQLQIPENDIKSLVMLTSDYIRCNDYIFNRLHIVTKCIMHVPSNKHLITNQLIEETKQLAKPVTKELQKNLCRNCASQT